MYANATVKLAAFEDLCKEMKVQDLTVRDINVAARIYLQGRKQGRMIEDTDLLIAAQAMANGYILVTNNTKHFEDISGLAFVNWRE